MKALTSRSIAPLRGAIFSAAENKSVPPVGHCREQPGKRGEKKHGTIRAVRACSLLLPSLSRCYFLFGERATAPSRPPQIPSVPFTMHYPPVHAASLDSTATLQPAMTAASSINYPRKRPTLV